MARWEPNGRERLERAALELFTVQGYAETTISQIAARANLSERTYYRHFETKRDVLFGAEKAISTHILDVLVESPEETDGFDRVSRALLSLGTLLPPREILRLRYAVIMTNAPLREYEILRLAALSAKVSETLIRLGENHSEAVLASELGRTVLVIAVRLWSSEQNTDFATTVSHLIGKVAQMARP